MFFCPICNNTFDITKLNIQSGGFDSSSDSTWEDSSFDKNTTDTPNFIKELQVGGDKGPLTDLFNKILTKQKISYEDIKKFKLKDIIKTSEYKKLDSKEKEYIYNTFKEYIPDNIKNIPKGNFKDENPSFFICSNCNFTKRIEDETLIYSKKYGKSIKTNVNNITDMIYDETLPHTRKYICQNKKCKTHNNPNIREAVFYRDPDSYKINYICTVCRSVF